MSRLIIINFGPKADVHRLRNFGEALYHMVRDFGGTSISLADIDKATNQLVVAVSSKRKVRRLTSEIEKLLDRHGFAEQAHIALADPTAEVDSN